MPQRPNLGGGKRGLSARPLPRAPARYILVMRRFLIALFFFASPAAAWEFTANPICTLSHATPDAALRVTYDPRGPVYAIALTRSASKWQDSPTFAIRFDGARGLTITTDRHKITDADTTLRVEDSGFSNVLNGLEFNREATALTSRQALAFPLDGIAQPMAAFRACVDGGTV